MSIGLFATYLLSQNAKKQPLTHSTLISKGSVSNY